MNLDEWATSTDIAAAHPEMAVFAIGAIEQHGAHLPIGTDWFAISEVARRVASELKALLLPPIPFSMSECHGPILGTVWLKPATLAAVLSDVVHSLYEQGIRKVLVLNGHGGNFILEPVIQSLNHDMPDIHVVMPIGPWDYLAENEGLFETASSEVHAGEVETSEQLYLNPDFVKPERKDVQPPLGREFLDYVSMNQISPDGVWGQPSLGDASKGERAISAQVRWIIAFAQRVFEALE